MSQQLKPYPEYFQRYIGKAEHEALIPCPPAAFPNLRNSLKISPPKGELCLRARQMDY